MVERDHPDPLLQALTIVDTHGTNAILREHEALTERFVPRADLVLFVTSADRPFSESERAFMERIRGWGKKIVVVLNKADLLAGPDEVAAQVTFVREGAKRLLGLEPAIFPVSARQALAAKGPGDPAARHATWEASGFGPLETYLRDALDDRERLRLKLLNPLGIAERLTRRYQDAAAARLATLRGDLQLGEHLAAQLEVYRAELQRDFDFRLQAIDNLLHGLNARGVEFFDNTLRLGRVFDLFNQGRIRAEFETQVVANTPGADRPRRAGPDRLDGRTGRATVGGRARAARSPRKAGGRPSERRGGRGAAPAVVRPSLPGSFERDRRALLGAIAATAREVVLRHDHAHEAESLAGEVRAAITGAALVEAGAVGFGAITLAIMGSVAADLTGILASIAIAGLGLIILPMQKRRVTEQFRQSTERLREQLTGAMREAFERELTQALERIRGALAPYERFARVEHDRAARLERGFADRPRSLAALRGRVERGCSRGPGAANFLGAILMLAAFALAQMHRLDHQSYPYLLLNLVGSAHVGRAGRRRAPVGLPPARGLLGADLALEPRCARARPQGRAPRP